MLPSDRSAICRNVRLEKAVSASDARMSQQAGDETPSSDPSRQGGFANVFRGLTNSKNSKPPSPLSSTTAPLARAEFVNTTPTATRGLSANHMHLVELLRTGTPNERIEAAHGLRFAISEYPLDPVLDIWYAAKDLIDPAKTTAARTAGWELLTECVKHASSTDLERQEYFQTLSGAANPEDFHLQLAAMVDLTNHGRILAGFDYELLPLLSQWLRDSYNTARIARKHASLSARGTKISARSRAGVSGEDKNLAQLFIFISDVIKFSFNSADETSLIGLIEVLLFICMNTSVEDDLRSCIAVVDAIVTFGAIPNVKLKDCVQVLSSIYCLVSNLQKDSWHTLANLCKSHIGQATVRVLLDTLRNLSTDNVNEKDVGREVRGALAVLRKLLSKSAAKGYPPVPYALLVDGMSNTVRATSSPRVHSAVLQLINSLFDDGNGQINRLVVDEDWSVPFDVAAECFKRSSADSERDKNPLSKDDRPEELVTRELLSLISRLDVVVKGKPGDFVPRQTIINFLTQVEELLPDVTAQTVLNYFQEFRCCSPSDLRWEENLQLVLNSFLNNRKRSSQTRLSALQTIKAAYEVIELVGDGAEQDLVPRLAQSVLQDITEERDTLVLDSIMSLMVSIATSSEMELFNYIVDTFLKVAGDEELRSPIASPSVPNVFSPGSPDNRSAALEPSPLNVVTKGFVKLFLQTMNSHCEKSVRLFDALVGIAKSCHCEADARLTAMKLLFRLRADWCCRIFVTNVLEVDSLATLMGRTEASFAKKQAEEAAFTTRLSRNEANLTNRSSRGVSFGSSPAQEKGLPVRCSSGLHTTRSKYHQVWKLPDPDALPQAIPSMVSPVLRSCPSSADDLAVVGQSQDKAISRPTAYALNMASWFEAVISMLKGCEWEVYSFVLAHLPSQLSNHAISRDAIPQIQELRRLICEQIRKNSFQEPPSASGLRRADVAICLYHSLTMILSYYAHFQKNDEDEIVRAFVLGIGTWERSAKCCIHALSICCHELPLSTSKSLVQILNQMAAIITQPQVSVHILEFLACLSRLHHLYVNFREDEYRIVFAICFRYLEYAREKRQLSRGSQSEPSTPASAEQQSNSSGEVPQYVHALAYHVILFWFLALKLPDRHNQVGWIVKKLFADADGAGQTADEQAITSIDFLQRVTYADVDESAEDAHFTEERFGEMAKKRWLIGNSIITVKQAVTTGWAQIVKRQPSGTSAYLVRETYRPPPPHQVENHVDIAREGQSVTNAILPSHLLVQLLSPVPQTFDSVRPIPLPDDEATERTIKIFDRNSSVDGHKVGVIYIGEGQTEESAILANVSGSLEYTEFLNKLGTLTRLKGAKFNTQGLDREHDTDGEYTFCWRDRVTEIVFHVTTQMPTHEHDPQGSLKKRHVGNDFVNIIFNDSGLPFNFDTFPSQFNFVNIVITPASQATFVASRGADDEGNQEHLFYRVQVMSKPGFPEISPASDAKMVSGKALPAFIRLLALNASMFSLVWYNLEGGEHISSWSGRLREIKRLRERHGPKPSGSAPTSPPPPAMGGNASMQPSDLPWPSSTVRDSFTSLRRTSVATFFTSTSEQPSQRSSTISNSATTTDTEVGASNRASSLVDSVDFSKWA